MTDRLTADILRRIFGEGDPVMLSNPDIEPRDPEPPWQLKRETGALERAEAKRARRRARNLKNRRARKAKRS